MEKKLHRSGLRDRCLRYKVIPAEHFSGDIVAASRSPSGHFFYALLADATVGMALLPRSASYRTSRCSTE